MHFVPCLIASGVDCMLHLQAKAISGYVYSFPGNFVYSFPGIFVYSFPGIFLHSVHTGYDDTLHQMLPEPVCPYNGTLFQPSCADPILEPCCIAAAQAARASCHAVLCLCEVCSRSSGICMFTHLFHSLLLNIFYTVFIHHAYCADGSEWRQRIEREAEHFLDVSSWSVGDIAGKISSDEIQIAINLNGYTKGARNEIFALLPAPVQTSYMGFPATTGVQSRHALGIIETPPACCQACAFS